MNEEEQEEVIAGVFDAWMNDENAQIERENTDNRADEWYLAFRAGYLAGLRQQSEDQGE
jgi:hypothetical protein